MLRYTRRIKTSRFSNNFLDVAGVRDEEDNRETFGTVDYLNANVSYTLARFRIRVSDQIRSHSYSAFLKTFKILDENKRSTVVNSNTRVFRRFLRGNRQQRIYIYIYAIVLRNSLVFLKNYVRFYRFGRMLVFQSKSSAVRRLS